MKTITKEDLIMFMAIIVTTLIQWIFNWNVSLYIVCSVSICIISIFTYKFNIMHPQVWFLPIFVAYQIGYPVIKLFGVDIFEPQIINENFVRISWLSIAILAILLLNIRPEKYDIEKITRKLNKQAIYIIYIVIIAICLLGYMYIVAKGYTNKSSIANSGSILVTLSSMCSTILPIVSTFLLLNSTTRDSEKKKIIITSIAVMIIGMGCTGERDYILRTAVMFLLYYYVYYKVSTKKIMALILGFLIVITFSSSLKMFMVKDISENTVGTENNNIIVKFFNSDFAAGGYNLNFLLNHSEAWEYKYGDTLIYDILSPIVDFFPEISKKGASYWYKNTFWANRTTGLGFSIVAEGYINFGIFGVVIWVVILAFFIRFMYKRSNKSIYSFIQYIWIYPTYAYMCRADLANVISPFFKYLILMCVIVYIVSYKKRR